MAPEPNWTFWRRDNSLGLSGNGKLDLQPVASRYIDDIPALVREGTARSKTVKNFLEALITSYLSVCQQLNRRRHGRVGSTLHRIWEITGSSLILEQAVLTSFGYFSPFSPGIWYVSRRQEASTLVLQEPTFSGIFCNVTSTGKELPTFREVVMSSSDLSNSRRATAT